MLEVNTPWINACITNISFPKEIDDVLGMVEKNRYFQDWKSANVIDMVKAPVWPITLSN
jgi:hypothetical protein